MLDGGAHPAALGGFVFIVSLTANLIYSEATESNNILRLILLCQIPILIVGLKEDIFNNVNPIIRMLSLLVVSCLFIINYDGQLPNLSGVPFVSKLILIQGGIGIFFVLSIITIAPIIFIIKESVTIAWNLFMISYYS